MPGADPGCPAESPGARRRAPVPGARRGLIASYCWLRLKPEEGKPNKDLKEKRPPGLRCRGSPEREGTLANKAAHSEREGGRQHLRSLGAASPVLGREAGHPRGAASPVLVREAGHPTGA